MPERFISEPIDPVAGTFDTTLMAGGAAGLPREFFWQRKKYTVGRILKTWRTTGPCRHGSGEEYTRRHWFEIATDSGETMKIYFDKGNRGKRTDMGWHLFALAESGSRGTGLDAKSSPPNDAPQRRKTCG